MTILRPKLRRLVVDLWAAEGAARDFSDPEGVHQMRVATRRLRAALDAGDGLFTRKPERRLRKDARRLARALGAVRDGDVMIDALRAIQDDGMPHPGIERLIRRLACQREGDRARLLDLLDQLDASDAHESSLALFRDAKRGKGKLCRRDARELIRRPQAGLLASTATLPDADDVEGLHRLRIAAKRFRYALQLVEEPLQPASTEILVPLAAMQDHLGDIHNADVLLSLVRTELHALLDERIASAGHGGPAPDETSAASDDLLQLLARTARERRDRYDAFASWWGDAQSTGFTTRLATLDTPRQETPKD